MTKPAYADELPDSPLYRPAHSTHHDDLLECLTRTSTPQADRLMLYVYHAIARGRTYGATYGLLANDANVEPFLNAIRNAKAPPKFTQRFLEELDFKSTNDRLFINLLKALGFLSADGAPTARYFEYLDQSQSARVLAEALEDAYGDLFQLRRDAQRMDRPELKGKIKTLTQGQVSDNVVDKMAMTFLALAEHADFEAPKPDAAEGREPAKDEGSPELTREPPRPIGTGLGPSEAGIAFGRLRIQRRDPSPGISGPRCL